MLSIRFDNFQKVVKSFKLKRQMQLLSDFRTLLPFGLISNNLLLHLLNHRLGNPGKGESPVVEQILHGHHFGKIGE